MSYCTAADLETALPDLRLAELSADSGVTADAAVLAAICTDASDEVDSYIGGRYATPVTTPTEAVRALRIHAIKIAVWLLWCRRLVAREPALAKENYSLTLQYLKRIQEGKGSLPGSASSTDATATSGGAWGSSTQVFKATDGGVL